jgi:hypothetical protein
MEMMEFPGKFELICKLTLSSLQKGLTFEVYTVRPTGSVHRNDFDIRALRSACELWSNHLTTPPPVKYPFYKKVGRSGFDIVARGGTYANHCA